MKETLPLLVKSDFPTIHRTSIDVLQVNLCYTCNMSCFHCHVAASPKRTEAMDREHLDLVLAVLAERQIGTLDLTGGAPEIHPEFRYLVSAARASGVKVIDRCNLTILNEPGHEDLAQFLADQQVDVVASLPCYLSDNVDAQRGRGVFDRSIEGLQQLNALGYGRQGSGLTLNLVFNPQGATLPPPQGDLHEAYTQHLAHEFGIVFNDLFTITNMPIKRFGSTLVTKGTFDEYMTLLKDNYSEANLAGVMCRSQISVDYLGYLYDCDFNQQLELPSPNLNGRPHLRDLLVDSEFAEIRVADHCYGCTAGQGSSCGGALADSAEAQPIKAQPTTAQSIEAPGVGQ